MNESKQPSRDRSRPADRGPAEEPSPSRGSRLADLDEFELEIEKLVAGGDGLGRVEGIPVFVPLSAPGDRLRVRLIERKPDYGRAEILEILRPGDGRREPPCPHFGVCGGCNLQHLEDKRQTELRAQATREVLERIGGLERGTKMEVISGAAWGYRMRTQLQVEVEGDRAAVGYFSRRSHELVQVSGCPVLEPDLERCLPEIARVLGPGAPRRLDLALGDEGQLTSAPVVDGLPSGATTRSLGGWDYRFDARCFFQAHTELLPDLLKTAIGPWRGQSAFDLYAGVGLFSVALGERYSSVTAVEGDRVAARYARMNGRRNRLQSFEVVARAVESWIRDLPEDSERVLVDPPRTGLARAVRRKLEEQPPQRLTYVSCHAAALARDLRQLQAVFEIEEVTFLDMFPQTGHMEVVVQLARREAGSRKPWADR